MGTRRRLWGAILHRRLYRPWGCVLSGHPGLLTLAVALLVAWGTIQILEWRLRPTVAEMARTQVQNTMTAAIEQAVNEDLARRNVSYGDFVAVERDAAGAITALSAQTAQMNLLRSELVGTILETLEGVDVSSIHLPLGSLLDFEPLWAKGPELQVRAMTVGTVSAEFDSEFSSAGINQTIHRIWLEVAVPMTVLLPGEELEVTVQTRLPLAETVIVGQVPNTYLSLDGGAWSSN
ncbi:sporulation protein YunB [Lawsonibacter sp. LCP25S3_G6]|uniref:sporulation protein YunB n=1 Tax=unclassified Lawsonibacter TaxID=2617946 RepID=UPI003F95AD9C